MERLSALNALPILAEIDSLKTEIDSLRPLSKDQEGRIMQKFRLDWNYHSNAIEGNSLNYGETVAFLMHGITAKGKPFKDYLDIRGHNNAIDYLLDLVRGNDYLTETDIRNLHQLLLGEPYEVDAQTSEGQPTRKRIIPGQYKTSPNHVLTTTGQIHYYAAPEETPAKMGDLMNWYRESSTDSELHPVVVAALFHHRFVSIHPFDDGNGRMTRLLMNLMLMRYHYPPTVIKQQDRGVYYLTLSQADTGDDEPFVQFIAENVKAGLELYLKGAKGESLDEPDDLDKELALFKMEIEGKVSVKEVKRTIENQYRTYQESFKPLLNQTRTVLTKFLDFFESYGEQVDSVLITDKLTKKFGNRPTRFEFDNFIESWLKSNDFSGKIGLKLSLSGYKRRPSTDIDIELSFHRLDYSYSIDYKFNDLDSVTIINGYYCEILSQSLIGKTANSIGRDILNLLKKDST